METVPLAYTGSLESVPVLGHLVLVQAPPDVKQFCEVEEGQHFEVGELEITIGSDDNNTIFLPHPRVQKEHIRLVWDQGRWSLLDMTDTLDVTVGDLIVKYHLFSRNGQSFGVGPFVFAFFFDASLHASYEKQLYQRSVTDALTGLKNRRVFERVLRHQLARCGKMGGCVSLLMIDIDHFKKINDTYGHPVGDAVLQQLARNMENQLRRNETLCRFGGEELALILPDTPHDHAMEVAERIRVMVKDNPLVIEGETIHLSVSIGVSCAVKSIENGELLRRADQNLYLAKEKGRNQVQGD